MDSIISNSIIELHDSEVAEITVKGDAEVVISFSPAYIHRSTGRPGVDAGTGWIQKAELKFTGATVTSRLLQVPQNIWKGHLKLADQLLDNEIPIPLNYEGPVELDLVFSTISGVVVQAYSVTLTLIGEARYIEEFRPT